MKHLMLEKLLQVLENNKGKEVFNYTVPDLWNCFDYDKSKLIKTPSNELIVNPFDFYASVIKDYIMPNITEDINYKQRRKSQK